MSTYTEILYQIVFGSKYCTTFLNPQNQVELFNYISTIIRNKKGIPYRVGGHGNHLHLITYVHPTICLSDFVREIKRSSHNWMVEKKDCFKFFPGWQVGYGVFSYSTSSKKNLIRYVENQAEHHKKVTFQEELIGLLEEHGIEYDIKYLFI